MKNRFSEGIILETKLDEVAAIYDGLLMMLENAVYEFSMKETFQSFKKRGIKLKETMTPLGRQIETVRLYRNRLIRLHKEIRRLDRE